MKSKSSKQAVEYVNLGNPLNHLLNRDTRLGKDETVAKGIELPTPGKRGGKMAVIVITGRPASGKSTLALQTVVSAAQEGYDSIYLSLEDHPDTVKAKAETFGWEHFIYIPKSLPPTLFNEKHQSAINRAQLRTEAHIKQARKQARKPNTKLTDTGMVIAASLLPRPVIDTPERSAEFFLQQYVYLETLVKAAAHSTNGIRMIVVDSLNMLSYSGQSRESLYRIFDLFRANGIMGIFTVDGNAAVPFDSTMADVVFSFSSKSDSSYLIHYLSIEKSRYTPTAFGLHPYKISKQHGIYVFPSLHAVVAAGQVCGGAIDGNAKELFPFGWSEEITRAVVRSTLRRPGVIVIHGPEGTRKSTIASNFLIHGLVGNEDSKKSQALESGILIRLRDTRDNRNLSEIQGYPEMSLSLQLRLKECDGGLPLVKDLRAFVSATKATIGVWGDKGEANGEVLVVINVHTGMLLPEEFVDIVRHVLDTLKEKNVKRVALDDVSVIGGGSYPLLERSETTADLFLSVFVHVMRNQPQGVDLMLVGTRGQLDSGNKIVDRAITLADSVIELKIRHIFGDRYVLLFGDGTMAEDASLKEWVPPAMRLVTVQGRPNRLQMKFDQDLLRGLTGFDGPLITRTKVYAYLYEENCDIHARYNRTLPFLLEPLCGLPEKDGHSGLQIISFAPHISDTIHRSDVVSMKRPPKEHTVLATIDEFAAPINATGKTPSSSGAYTNNVLLVAWRTDLTTIADVKPSWKTWQQLLAFSNSVPYKRRMAKVWVDRGARETFSCCLVDCLLSGLKAAGSGIGFDKEREAWDQLLEELTGREDTETFGHLVREAKAMHDLLSHGRRSVAWSAQSHPLAAEASEDSNEYIQSDAIGRTPHGGLPEDAAIYICWYSQLRELLARCNQLAGKFAVEALPGGGFEGDWKLCVLEGSVSQSLGEAVVKALTQPDEDYRRFALGIGLPVGRDGQGKGWKDSTFRAWPGAAADVSIRKVYKIHCNAMRRSKIPNYPRITRVLTTVAKRLAGDWDKNSKMTDSKIAEHLRRIPTHISALVDL